MAKKKKEEKLYTHGYLLKDKELKQIKRYRKKYGKDEFYFDHEITFFAGDIIRVTVSSVTGDTVTEKKYEVAFIRVTDIGEKSFMILRNSEGEVFFVPVWSIDLIEIIKRNSTLESLNTSIDFIDRLSENEGGTDIMNR